MSVPFALSIHSFVNSIGAYVGFGSIVAVALLVLLYFAHARETATLRERLDDAQQHISGLEARISQLLQSQGAARGRVPGMPPTAPVPPVPAPGRAGAVQPQAVRRVPSPVTAAAGAAPVPPVRQVPGRPPAGRNGFPPAAPVGVGAPALASATKVLPEPAVAPGAPAADDTILVPAGAQAANGHSDAPSGLVAPAKPLTARAAAAPTPSASPRGSLPPRAQIGAEPDPEESSGSVNIRRIGGAPRAAAPFGSLLDETPRGGRFAGRLLPLLIGAVAIAVIVAGLIIITTSSGGGAAVQGSQTKSGPTGAALKQQHQKVVPFTPGAVKVAVLNGTAQAGLAGAVGKKLGTDGYRQGTITNAASQTQTATYVYYVTGRARATNRIAALHVAKALGLGAARVRPANHAALSSCSISASGAALGSCSATVIVSVGQDLVSLATGG